MDASSIFPITPNSKHLWSDKSTLIWWWQNQTWTDFGKRLRQSHWIDKLGNHPQLCSSKVKAEELSVHTWSKFILLHTRLFTQIHHNLFNVSILPVPFAISSLRRASPPKFI